MSIIKHGIVFSNIHSFIFKMIIKAIHTKQNAVCFNVVSRFTSFNSLPSTVNSFIPTMPIKRLVTPEAVAISSSSVLALFNPSVVKSSVSKVFHDTIESPTTEWLEDGNNYFYYDNGKYTKIYVTKINWLPVICFPYKIQLKKGVWRVCCNTKESYIVDLPKLEDAKEVAESYYKIYLEVNSNGTVSNGQSVS